MYSYIINKTNNYIETLNLRSIESLPDHYEMMIQSQLLDAKDPDALHVKYRSIVSESALRELRDALDTLLVR
jgi:hypothetical protein